MASHIKSRQKGKHTTVKEHMPRSHQAYLEWTPSRIVGWAEKTGPATAALAAAIMEGRTHPQQGFRSCLGVMRLGKEYGPQRLEAACARSLHFGDTRYRRIKEILRAGLDREPLTEDVELVSARAHLFARSSAEFFEVAAASEEVEAC